jgi:hypothetical protein
MRHRYWIGLAFAVTALIATATPASATPTDPAPHGPQRPDESYVDGPANLDTIDVTVRRDGGSRHGITVAFDRRSRTETGEKPAAARRFVFLFDSSIRFNARDFPVCTREVIERQGVVGCPDGSQVGSGRVDIFGLGTTDVAVFNTRYASGMRGMLITVPVAGVILENTFERVSWPYRTEFAWASDEILPPDATPPQDRNASTRFEVTFGATWQGRSFVESVAPAGRTLAFGEWSEFVTGQVVLPRDTAIRP